MKFTSVFDIIGPVMIGPSSSHTAGAARIGRVARDLFGNLRFSDYYGVDTIIVEGIDDKEMGLAIMNRLRKAADIKVVT